MMIKWGLQNAVLTLTDQAVPRCLKHRAEKDLPLPSLSKARQIAIPKPLAAIFLRSLAKAAWCCD
jgi:hypothetical protein